MKTFIFVAYTLISLWVGWLCYNLYKAGNHYMAAAAVCIFLVAVHFATPKSDQP